MEATISNRSESLLAAVLLVGPLAMSVTPLFSPIFFAILSIILIGTAWRRGTQWRDLLPRTPAIAACLLLAIYIFVNATWSADPATALRKAAVYAGLVFMSFAAVHAVAAFDRDTLRRAGLFLAAGIFAGALFVLIEMVTHGLMSTFLMNRIPILKPKSGALISQGQITALERDVLSHHVGLVTYNLWPGLLALGGLKGIIRLTALIFFSVTIAILVMISGNAATQVALLSSSLVVVAMWYWPPQYVVRALAICWCASFVLVIPASFVAYQSGLHLAPWLQRTARQRIIIWEYTAEQISKHPLLGVGVEATPVLNQRQKLAGAPDQPVGFAYPRSLGSHAHNIYLQAWFELGAMGVLLLAMAGVGIVMLIPLLPHPSQPFAAGTFVTFVVVGAFSWGMWQAWFMSEVALLPLFLRIASGAKFCQMDESRVDCESKTSWNVG